MLFNQSPAVDGDDLPAREAAGKHLQRLGILRKPVHGHQHRTIDDEKIGIRSRQPMAVVGINGRRPGQRHEAVALAIGLAECLQLLLHCPQGRKMLVCSVIAAHIRDGFLIAKTSQCVDMTVRIIARQVAVFEPQEAIDAEVIL